MHPHWVAVDLRQSQLGLRLILSNTIAAPTITATSARTETIQKDPKGPRCCPQRPHKPATPAKIIQRIKIARHRGWENQRGGRHDTQSKQQPPGALPLSLDLESLDQQLKHQQRL